MCPYKHMPSRGEVVIVSGPPGSGKTTVSAALASGYERGVHLEWFFRHKYRTHTARMLR